MNKIRIIITVFLTSILQIALAPRISIFGVTPSFSIPVLVMLSIGFGSFEGGFSGLFLGLIEDVYFSNMLGPRALIYFVICYIMGHFEYRISTKNNRIGIGLTALFTMLNFLFILLGELVFSGSLNIASYLFGPIFIEIVLNSLIYYFMMKFFNKFFIFPNIRFY
ncbi:rod shape-determining protein MreD [Citroniella saccharovorans]|uniref:Rod shape-determining protein MreD n=1 Tax=Citroniella saccharovorans TaxID=2053367 RepID=A0AAW9MV01_9FIRM|nr:rod shape-determining protein MreD [Citroniella saccharovorans]MEB3429880.1 rod shape-determining protein MreD [Citroniella saccharovorans]